jgi:hypothetical protein
MTDVYFISEELLKNRTAINENVDSGELRFCIQTAQNLNIQETLGQALFEQIVNEVSGNTIAGNNKFLLDNYIVPTTIAWSYYHGLDNFFVKWMNVGLVANRTEQGSNIDFKTFQFLKNNARSTAEFYDNNMRRYLCAFASNFPKYNTVEIGKLLPQRDSAFRNAMAMGAGRSFYPSWYGPVKTQSTGGPSLS